MSTPSVRCTICGYPRQAHGGPRPIVAGLCTGFEAPPAVPTAEELTAALRAILPYARSRLEDMEECANKAWASGEVRLGAQADEDLHRARAALLLAEGALR